MTNNRPIKEPTDGELLHESLVRNHISLLCPSYDGHLDQAATEFSRPYRERIAEIEAENTRLRSVFVPPGSALILIAPETASQDEMHDATKRAAEVHDGPVIMLAHDWQSMPVDELRTKIDGVASKHTAPTSDHVHEIGSCSYCDKSGASHDGGKS